ncbi:MAG: hypothetical protein QOD74_482 [Variibacter sp.]|nr:hypothetical protein [Variibacter sp.]
MVRRFGFLVSLVSAGLTPAHAQVAVPGPDPSEKTQFCSSIRVGQQKSCIQPTSLGNDLYRIVPTCPGDYLVSVAVIDQSKTCSRRAVATAFEDANVVEHHGAKPPVVLDAIRDEGDQQVRSCYFVRHRGGACR